MSNTVGVRKKKTRWRGWGYDEGIRGAGEGDRGNRTKRQSLNQKKIKRVLPTQGLWEKQD